MRSAMLALSLTILALTGCQTTPPQAPAAPPGPAPAAPAPTAGTEQATPPTGRLRIAVVPKAVSQQFWTTVRAGAEAAGKELGAEIIWKGANSETEISVQKGIVEDFITQKVNAIVLAACDADALVDTIKRAERSGIPVITIDSGVNWPDVRCLVATDNVAGARTAGETLIKLIGGQGKVGLIPFVKGSASSNAREEGFRQAVAAAKGVTLAATNYSNSDEGKGKSAAQDMLTSVPTLAGIFAANEAGAVGAAGALREMGKAGQVKLVGFDGSPAEVHFLEQGVIQALVVQDPFKMGHEGVAMAVKAAKGQKVPKTVNTGVTVITKANLNSPEVQKLLNP